MKMHGVVFEGKGKSSQIRDHRESIQDPEAGSVEAGMTFIPTTAFFLLVIQLVISGSFQVFETLQLQNFVTRSALGQELPLDGDLQSEFLPGGGELVVAKSKVKVPMISNLISVAPVMKIQAVAIAE